MTQKRRSERILQLKLASFSGQLTKEQRQAVGNVGEDIAAFALTDMGFSWMKIDQRPYALCENIADAGGKRPDFIVNAHGETFLLEVKHLKMRSTSDGAYLFFVDRNELAQSAVNSNLFKLDIMYFVCNQKTESELDRTYAIVFHDDFTIKHEHNNGYMGAMVKSSDFFEVDLRIPVDH